VLVLALDCALKYSESQYYLDKDSGSTFTMQNRNLEPGPCFGVAILYWIDDKGTERFKVARSQEVHVMGILEP
jgi:hypothetical protein